MSRRLAVWTIIVLAFLGLVAAAALGGSDAEADGVLADARRQGASYTSRTVQAGGGDRVALVPITGVIVGGGSAPDGSATGSDDVVPLIEAIVESDRYDGIVLELDTPGGGVLASAEIADAVADARREGIKVVSWMRTSAASGGYYIAAGTDRIVAAPSTLTGSIGVILQYLELGGLGQKIGVESVVIKSGRLKDIGSPYRDITPEERRVLQSIIDDSYGDFVEIVAKGRDMSETEVRAIADGRVVTGRQAQELDLVDTLGLRDTAYDEMAEVIGEDDADDLEVVRFARESSVLETLLAGAPSGIRLADLARVADAPLPDGGSTATPRPEHVAAGGSLPVVEYRAVL